MQPDEPTDEERAEQLAQDGQTPFTPADPNPPTADGDDAVTPQASTELPVDHPATDSNIESGEAYDEGTSGAAEVSDTLGQSDVVSYDPDNQSDEAL